MPGPRPFDPEKPHAVVRGHPTRAFKQRGWYYDQDWNPIEEAQKQTPSKRVLRMRHMNRKKQTQRVLGDLGRVELDEPPEIKRARRENARVRAAEELSE